MTLFDENEFAWATWVQAFSQRCEAPKRIIADLFGQFVYWAVGTLFMGQDSSFHINIDIDITYRCFIA
jgi:hypothetical protein